MRYLFFVCTTLLFVFNSAASNSLSQWKGSVPLPFTSEIHWKADPKVAPKSLIESIDISNNYGTLVYKGKKVPAILMAYQSEGPGQDFGGILAPLSNNLLVIDLLCENGLVSMWQLSSLEDPITEMKSSRSGTCQFHLKPTVTDVQFISWKKLPKKLVAVPKIKISGQEIELKERIGKLKINGKTFRFVVMSTHDWTADPTSGWIELYSVIFSDSYFGFGDLYLMPKTPNVIPLRFGFRFDKPGFEPPRIDYRATWTFEP